MYTVYKIEYKQHCYVGITKKPVAVRFSQHKSNAKRQTKSLLYDAMRCEGIDRFSVDTIGIFDDVEVAADMELEMIEKYGTLNSSCVRYTDTTIESVSKLKKKVRLLEAEVESVSKLKKEVKLLQAEVEFWKSAAYS